MSASRIIELILTYEVRGNGTQEDPLRECTQLWTKAGEKVLHVDPHSESQTTWNASALKFENAK